MRRRKEIQVHILSLERKVIFFAIKKERKTGKCFLLLFLSVPSDVEIDFFLFHVIRGKPAAENSVETRMARKSIAGT